MTPGATPRTALAQHTQHTIVVDLGFGDAGKGTVVDHLCARAAAECRPVRAVVRFNGGAQAAHNVVTDDGRHHTFAQFGSGTLAAGTPTHLSRHMLVEPLALASEAGHLRRLGVPDPLATLTVHRDALLTTPWHRAAGRLRERRRGPDRHGSCGVGVGETAGYALAHPQLAPRVGDCTAPARLRRRLRALRDHLTELLAGCQADEHRRGTDEPHDAALSALPDPETYLDTCRAFGRAVRLVDDDWLPRTLRTGPVLFEGAQGVLLDQWYGFHPYTTWSTTTFAGAEQLLADAGQPGAALRVGVLRTVTTRHGPGPLVSEDPRLTAGLGERHNDAGRWQGPFRVGHFDAVAHRYALRAAGGVDALALTHLDVAHRLTPEVCTGYRVDGALLTALPSVPPPPRSGPGLRPPAGREDTTRALMRARPVLEPVPDPTVWPELVGALLGANVTLTSHGPRTHDKRGAGVHPTNIPHTTPATTPGNRPFRADAGPVPPGVTRG